MHYVLPCLSDLPPPVALGLRIDTMFWGVTTRGIASKITVSTTQALHEQSATVRGQSI